jgi:hypothetical protein
VFDRLVEKVTFSEVEAANLLVQVFKRTPVTPHPHPPKRQTSIIMFKKFRNFFAKIIDGFDFTILSM